MQQSCESGLASAHLQMGVCLCVRFPPCVSSDMFQVCINTWNSSLNRSELVSHLQIAHSQGGMKFQASRAEKTRTFIKAILEGKGIMAECKLTPLQQSVPAFAACAAAAEQQQIPQMPATLQSSSCLQQLFLAAVAKAEPLWFHPSAGEQLSMSVPLSASAPSTISDAASSRPRNHSQHGDSHTAEECKDVENLSEASVSCAA